MRNSNPLLRSLVITAFGLCLVVVVLGAYVRLSAAGLGCPDWPGCYGHLTPPAVSVDGVLVDVGKGWREMIHRYAAGTLVLLLVAIATLAIQTRRKPLVAVPYAAGLLGLVFAQALLGMLTVTQKLAPWIVTAHLVLGMSTLATLWWLVLTISRRHAQVWRGATPFVGSSLPGTQRLALIALLALALQIMLGGWTSSHYAATACPDFPTCQGAWWPPMYGNVAIHFLHRLGALLAAGLLAWAGIRVLRVRHDRFAHLAAIAVLGALGLQLTLGVLMVTHGFPLPIATAHNFGAALLLLATVALNRSLRPA